MKVSAAVWFITIAGFCVLQGSASFLPAYGRGLSLFSGQEPKKSYVETIKTGVSKLADSGIIMVVSVIITFLKLPIKSVTWIPGVIFDIAVKLLISLPLKFFIWVQKVKMQVLKVLVLLPFNIMNAVMVKIPVIGKLISLSESVIYYTFLIPFQITGRITLDIIGLIILVPAAMFVQAIHITRYFTVGLVNLPLTLLLGLKDAELEVLKWWSGV